MMQRKQFLKSLFMATAGTGTLHTLAQLADALPQQSTTMPVLFIGHGSPMNGIEHNMFSQQWKQLGTTIPQPSAVLVVSAHWYTAGTRITAMEQPATIHDFGGFPQALFDVQYPAPGNPQLAAETAALLQPIQATLDHEWGLDHGTWTIVRHMYPQANIPVLQLSIDYKQSPQSHYNIAKALQPLRQKGVLIIGSGNMVHNLRMVAWDQLQNTGYGYDWALEINETFKRLIETQQHQQLIHYNQLGKAAQLAIPTPEHYLPLLYTLGLQTKKDAITFFNDQAVGGSLTMTSVQIG